MAKVDGNQPGVKPGAPAAPATSPPRTPSDTAPLSADALKVAPGSAPPTEAAIQAAAVAAAKAALGATAASPAAAVGSFKPKTLWQRATEASSRIAAGLGKVVAGDHPIAAISRGALRMVPFAGVLPLAHDSLDAAKTLTDSKVPLWQKALVGAKVATGAAAVGAAGLLMVTGATAFVPWALGAGAAALVADVAMSRIRTGHW